MSVEPFPDQRTAVVTGAGGRAGIGRAVARTLAETGWSVALVDIDADGLAAVEASLAALGGRVGTTSHGYDARGRIDVIAGEGRTFVDRAL